MTRLVPLVLLGCVSAARDSSLMRPSQRSELVLRCEPADAQVELDGVPQGTCADFTGAPRGLGLGSGTRRVAVTKPGFAPWQRWFDADHTRVMMQVMLVANGERAR